MAVKRELEYVDVPPDVEPGEIRNLGEVKGVMKVSETGPDGKKIGYKKEVTVTLISNKSGEIVAVPGSEGQPWRRRDLRRVLEPGKVDEVDSALERVRKRKRKARG